MEYIIKKWEQVIAFAIICGYFIFTKYYILSKRTYAIDEDLQALQKQKLILIYGLVIIVCLLLLIREGLIKRRIDIDKSKVIYSPNIRIYYIRLVIFILMNIIYWVLYFTKINIPIMYILVVMSLLVLPTSKFDSVFENETYIICSGNKYYYKDIIDVKKYFKFSLKLETKYKDVIIQCLSKKKYLILCDRLSKYR